MGKFMKECVFCSGGGQTLVKKDICDLLEIYLNLAWDGLKYIFGWLGWVVLGLWALPFFIVGYYCKKYYWTKP